jgi:hypothetical protein
VSVQDVDRVTVNVNWMDKDPFIIPVVLVHISDIITTDRNDGDGWFSDVSMGSL